MLIRMLTMSQLPEALVLANYLFDKEMAPFVPSECTASFHAFASEAVIRDMMQKGTLHVWGAFDDQERIAGVASMNDPCHVSMLCVREDVRRQGISRQLLNAMASYGAMPGDRHALTVNALKPTVGYLEHVGFRATGQVLNLMGVEYLPMQLGGTMEAHSAYGQRRADAPQAFTSRGDVQERMPGWLKAVIALICILAIAIFLYAASMIVTKSIGLSGGKESGQDPGQDIWQFGQNEPDQGQDSGNSQDQGGEEQEDTGINAIPAYKAKDVSYDIKDQAFSESDAEGKYTVQIEVHYPQIEGLEKNQDEINEKIRDFALKTEKEIYENPDQVRTKKILELEKVIVYNDVTYQVCYQTNDFISIAFNDLSLLGDSEEQGEVRIRALNMDLTNGKVYETADVFAIDDSEFRSAWEASLKKEAGDKLELPALGEKEDVAILSGKNEHYPPAFFVDRDGVEIGFSIVGKDSGGWVTAPIPKDEIVQYGKESRLWEQVTWK